MWLLPPPSSWSCSCVCSGAGWEGHVASWIDRVEWSSSSRTWSRRVVLETTWLSTFGKYEVMYIYLFSKDYIIIIMLSERKKRKEGGQGWRNHNWIMECVLNKICADPYNHEHGWLSASSFHPACSTWRRLPPSAHNGLSSHDDNNNNTQRGYFN